MKKILIVDDDPMIHFALTEVLRDLCDEVKSVESGAEAVSEMDRSLYTLCFLDINLPDSSGIDLMKQMVEISPDTKIIMMSSSRLDDGLKREIYSQAHYFLRKPFDLFLVKTIANQVLKVDKT
ncbi:MAG: response regulator [Deltaproteobacteria bacterium]|nr:response regulator [Deltaproteobacteria bacterium]NIS78224.1 response regulator [Deltaproteobacteria bacterium]